MTQKNNPLHGLTLEFIVTDLVQKLGWEALGDSINIRCFTQDPSIKSSLKFLRKQQWARDKVEDLYLKVNKLPSIKREQKKENIQLVTKNKNSGANADIWGKTQK